MKRTMVSRYLLIALFMLQLLWLSAQAPRSFSWYDSVTYRSYLDGDWKTLVRSGKEALRNGYDYFYLRSRMAEAAFHLGRYRDAAFDYDKALKFNSSDAWALEMKYYTELNLGDRDRALRAAYRLQPAQRTGLPALPHSWLDFGYFETGIMPSGLDALPGYALCGKDSIYGEEDLSRSGNYYSLGIRLRLKPGITGFIGGTLLNVDKTHHFEYYSSDMQRDSIVKEDWGSSYYYSFPRTMKDSSFQSRLGQQDLYFNINWQVASRLSISPALHLAGMKTKHTTAVYSQETKTDTAWYQVFDDSWHFFDYTAERYAFSQSDSSFRNWVASLQLSWDLRRFNLCLNAATSSFNNTKIRQAGGTLTWYPLGNHKLYGSVSATFQESQTGKQWVMEPGLGFQAARFLWFSGFATLGRMENYHEKNAYIVYNQPDPITFRAGADALLVAGRHLEFLLIYRYYEKETSFFRFVPSSTTGAEQPFEPVRLLRSYSNNAFTAGIKWKF